jgi:transposase
MKKAASRIREKTIQRLWSDTQSSVRNQLPPVYVEVLETHLRDLWSDFLRHEQRKLALEKQLVDMLERIRRKDPRIPAPTKGVISAKNEARLLGELGDPGDFDSPEKTLRYAGLNIRMRQSGKYLGQFKITKKGRPLLRKILGQIALPLVRRKNLYGEFYHRKREQEKMPGNKAMTVVMRNFLKKFHFWYRSGQAFDKERWFGSHTHELKKTA